MRRKRPISDAVWRGMIIAEIIICYLACLTMVSYIRGPEHYRVVTDTPLLQTEDFLTFAGVPAEADGVLSLENAVQGEAAGYMARLRLSGLEQVQVSFQIECPAEFAGGLLSIDLYNFEADYDSLEQEHQLTVQEGNNEVTFWLAPGEDPPEEAFLRIFTLDPAGYRLEDIQVCQGELLPKISAVLWIGVGIWFLLLAGTVFMWMTNPGTKKKGARMSDQVKVKAEEEISMNGEAKMVVKEETSASDEIKMSVTVRQAMQEMEGDNKTAALYAYRYLLGREPESMLQIISNTIPWPELRRIFTNCDEFLLDRSCFLAQDLYTTQRFINAHIAREGNALNFEGILERGYRKLIRTGDTVIDVGAYMGRHLSVFRELVGDGKLFAFEPLPKQFQYLKDTFCAPNISLYNSALSNMSGKNAFFELPDYPEESGLKLKPDKKDMRQNKIEVEVHCLDEYEDDLKGLNYIKIDTEGAEVFILEGAEKLLRRYRPFVSTKYWHPCYASYGLSAHSLFDFCEKNDYFITDLWGNVMLNLKVWEEIVNSCYWDYFLVPKERIREFSLAMHGM